MAVDMDRFTMSRLAELRWCPMRRRVRAKVGNRTIVDSIDVVQVWEPYRVVGCYAVPVADIDPALENSTAVSKAAEHPPILTPDHPFGLHTASGTSWDIPVSGQTLTAAAFVPDDPDLAGYVALDWAAFDEWWDEEDLAVSHPHDPFKRIDCLATSRHVVVRIGDTVLAESHRPTLLLETYLPPRHYFPRDDVRMDRLVPSETRTACAYKGHATYWSALVDGELVADVAWTYLDPLQDGLPVRDLICFYDDRVDLTVHDARGR
ncbi:DUF427 domain-containing protein [Gordonia sp. CPCC 205515]|uniref:DUF427 domain-containing protein n=1 Tax=Gordonia sp. CPCC 205515 TaxID=3140791 RepID=UPI003AF3CC97